MKNIQIIENLVSCFEKEKSKDQSNIFRNFVISKLNGIDLTFAKNDTLLKLFNDDNSSDAQKSISISLIQDGLQMSLQDVQFLKNLCEFLNSQEMENHFKKIEDTINVMIKFISDVVPDENSTELEVTGKRN